MNQVFEEFSFFTIIIIPIIFFISRKALRERKSFMIIFFITIIFALITTYKISVDEFSKPNFLLFWYSPLYSLLLYRLMLMPFWKRKKRDPKIPPRELFYLGDICLLADKLFGFVFILLSILLPMILIFNY
jgi:glucan phosphoethanolaminetransferase (alkaline phosphatase superfamily)